MPDPQFVTVQNLEPVEPAAELLLPAGVDAAGIGRFTLAQLKAWLLDGFDPPADGADGRTILHGAIAPDNALGHDGDFYVDVAAWQLYGPKAEGAWPAPVSATGLKGDKGDQGDQGPTGDVADRYFAHDPGTEFAIDLVDGTFFECPTEGDATITLPAAAAGKNYTVWVAFGGVHALEFVGGTALAWDGDVEPDPDPAAGRVAEYVFTSNGAYTVGALARTFTAA